MIRRLRQKFVLINMSIVTSILGALFFALLSATRAGMQADSLTALQRAAALPGLSATYENTGTRVPCFTVDIDPSGAFAVVGGAYYVVQDAAGLESIVRAGLAAADDVGLLKEYGLRFYRLDMPLGVRIAFADVSLESSVIRRFAENALVVGAAALLLFLGISVLLARWAVRPVEAALRQQRLFVEDASHELRTPLTIIMSNADMLLTHPGADADRLEKWTGGIKSESQRMRGLVDEMLSLARADAGLPKKGLSDVDLSAVATDCALELEATAYESGKKLSTAVEDGVFVSGQAGQLRRLVGNLLVNAIKYGDERGRIEMTLSVRKKRARLTVANTGRSIEKAELSRIFERFRRLDEARESGGGYGLGLAIAKGVAVSHGGSIRAESCGGWNRFIVELPLLAARRFSFFKGNHGSMANTNETGRRIE